MSKGKMGQAQLRVQIRSLPIPDADGRIARAISILLIAAARHTDLSEENTKPEKETTSQRTAQEGLTSSGEVGD